MNFWVILSKNWGKIIGGLVGLITALLILNYGWGTLLIYAFVALGAFLGWRFDVDQRIRHIIERFFSSREDY